uniref:DDE-type integrase/transposase/recombinase n=1 Tax=Burkholderia gladioli TaxID=28095 RepID=UPI00358DD68F
MKLYDTIVTEKLRCYAASNTALGLCVEHRQHKGLNNRAENSHQPTRVREKVMRRFKSACQRQRFASVHGQVSNLFVGCRYHRDAKRKRVARAQAKAAWNGRRAPAWPRKRIAGGLTLPFLVRLPNNLTVPPKVKNGVQNWRRSACSTGRSGWTIWARNRPT